MIQRNLDGASICPRTFCSGIPERLVEVVDRGEQCLDVQDKLLGHADALHVVTAADMSQHLRDAGGRTLFERGQDGPDPVHLLLHPFLPRLERRRRLLAFDGEVVWRCGRRRGGVALGGTLGSGTGRRGRRRFDRFRSRSQLDIPELSSESRRWDQYVSTASSTSQNGRDPTL